MAREIPWFRLAGVGVVAIVVALIVLVVRGASSVPDDVQPIDWHKQPCAHCQMLVGEPAHAGQLITAEGDVLSFDDPGCALRYLEERRPTVHRLWFHHATEDRWLASDRVAFRTGGTTPMASGLLAVEPGTPGAIDLATARTHQHAPAGHGAAALVPHAHLEMTR